MMYPGHEKWVTRDYGGEGKALYLNAAVLGTFMVHLFRIGGCVLSVWALNPKYDDSYVQMMISLPKGKKEELEKLSGIALETPPRIVVSGDVS